jgi:hypothetical protein
MADLGLLLADCGPRGEEPQFIGQPDQKGFPINNQPWAMPFLV